MQIRENWLAATLIGLLEFPIKLSNEPHSNFYAQKPSHRSTAEGLSCNCIRNLLLTYATAPGDERKLFRLPPPGSFNTSRNSLLTWLMNKVFWTTPFVSCSSMLFWKLAPPRETSPSLQAFSCRVLQGNVLLRVPLCPTSYQIIRAALLKLFRICEEMNVRVWMEV